METDIVTRIKGKQDLTDEIIFGLARGISSRALCRILEDDFPEEGTFSVIEMVQAAVHFGDQIAELREQLDEQAFDLGLARKGERLRKLNELAEYWEVKARGGDKSAGVFLRILEQARKETDGLGIYVIPTRGDKWMELIQELRSPDQLPKKSEPSSETSS